MVLIICITGNNSQFTVHENVRLMIVWMHFPFSDSSFPANASRLKKRLERMRASANRVPFRADLRESARRLAVRLLRLSAFETSKIFRKRSSPESNQRPHCKRVKSNAVPEE